tara:strand:+ start:591 stop:1382 length:792 start_codon:yes stop_codon:yes gene_type:complete
MAKGFIKRFGGTGGMVGQASIERAQQAGMSIKQIRKALSEQGIGTGQKATEYLAAGGRTLTPSGAGPTAYTQQFDQGNLAASLKVLGTQGGGIGIQGYKDLVSMGHSPFQLQEAVKEAATKGLRIGTDLETYFRSGVDPREERAFEDKRNDLYQQEIDQTMADAEALRTQMADQFRRSQLAAAERAKAAKEAQRMQLIRERGAGRAQNLQIQGAASAPRGRGGSTGFRRRQDQFRISPYKGVGIGGGVIGSIAKAAANTMVNI